MSGIAKFTKADFDSWRFARDSVHINGGREFFGTGHHCVNQPRLLVIDKFFKKDRSTQRSYVIDGRTACATLEEALAALSTPPTVSAEDVALLRTLPLEEWSSPKPRVPYITLANMGLIEWGRDQSNTSPAG